MTQRHALRLLAYLGFIAFYICGIYWLCRLGAEALGRMVA